MEEGVVEMADSYSRVLQVAVRSGVRRQVEGRME